MLFHTTLRAADSMFTSPVTYQAQEVGVAPLRSVQGYRSDQKAFQTSNNLREAGLSEKEVEMVLGAEGGGGRVKVEPSAMQGRISAVQEVYTPLTVCCLVTNERVWSM